MDDLSGTMWRKASRSASNGGDCVELAEASDMIVIRDSKDLEGPRLCFTAAEFRRFAAGVKNA